MTISHSVPFFSKLVPHKLRKVTNASAVLSSEVRLVSILVKCDDFFMSLCSVYFIYAVNRQKITLF